MEEHEESLLSARGSWSSEVSTMRGVFVPEKIHRLGVNGLFTERAATFIVDKLL